LRGFVIKLLFATGPSLNTRLLVVVLLSVALLALDQQNSRLSGVRSALSVVVYPIQALVNLPVQVSRQLIKYSSSYNALQEENAQLKKQGLLHKTDLLKLATLEKENIRLRALLERSFKLGEQFLVAELISVNQAPYEHIVVVDKGTHFGIHPKQPVLDANGVIGQVIRALPLSSEVMLITDPNHAISVEVSRNGLRTIAVGSGQYNRLNLPFLPNNADILPGDVLMTSGLDSIFPQGYPVAVVDKFIPQPNKPFADISATPMTHLDRTREVLIAWNNAKLIPIPLGTTNKAPLVNNLPADSPPSSLSPATVVTPAPTPTVKNSAPE
jgi:rod shape-determining protein MreC